MMHLTDMTREQALAIIQEMVDVNETIRSYHDHPLFPLFEKVDEVFRLCLEILKIEPCEEAVSINDVRDGLKSWKMQADYYHPNAKNTSIPIECVEAILRDAEPVYPKDKREKWAKDRKRG